MGEGAILKQIIRFAAIGRHDAIGDETVANPCKNGQFAQCLCKLNGRCEHIIGHIVWHDNLQEFHDMCR